MKCFFFDLGVHLEEDSDCSFDSVSVYDVNSDPNAGGLIGKYCGDNLPPQMTSTGEKMSISFVSDSSIAHEGFMANYVQLDSSSGKKNIN